MPTESMSGGSLAPIENSPPGIHTIPGDADVDTRMVFAIVASNVVDDAPAGATGAAAVPPFLTWNLHPANARSSMTAAIGTPNRHLADDPAAATRARRFLREDIARGYWTAIRRRASCSSVRYCAFSVVTPTPRIVPPLKRPGALYS